MVDLTSTAIAPTLASETEPTRVSEHHSECSFFQIFGIGKAILRHGQHRVGKLDTGSFYGVWAVVYVWRDPRPRAVEGGLDHS
jgi:hypothetical protein